MIPLEYLLFNLARAISFALCLFLARLAFCCAVLLPPPPPVQPRDSAIEDTADAVVVGKQAKQKTGRVKAAVGRRMGTRSLQIPLLPNSMAQGSTLNYPV